MPISIPARFTSSRSRSTRGAPTRWTRGGCVPGSPSRRFRGARARSAFGRVASHQAGPRMRQPNRGAPRPIRVSANRRGERAIQDPSASPPPRTLPRGPLRSLLVPAGPQDRPWACAAPGARRVARRREPEGDSGCHVWRGEDPAGLAGNVGLAPLKGTAPGQGSAGDGRGRLSLAAAPGAFTSVGRPEADEVLIGEIAVELCEVATAVSSWGSTTAATAYDVIRHCVAPVVRLWRWHRAR